MCAEHPTSVPNIRKISAIPLMMLQVEAIAETSRQKGTIASKTSLFRFMSLCEREMIIMQYLSKQLKPEPPTKLILFEFLGSSKELMRNFEFGELLGPVLNSVLHVCLTNQTKNLGDHPAAFEILGLTNF